MSSSVHANSPVASKSLLTGSVSRSSSDTEQVRTTSLPTGGRPHTVELNPNKGCKKLVSGFKNEGLEMQVKYGALLLLANQINVSISCTRI